MSTRATRVARGRAETHSSPPPTPILRVGFLLLPRFTLTAFSGFVDALRLAADEGDRSRPLHCTWSVLGDKDTVVQSSSGVSVEWR